MPDFNPDREGHAAQDQRYLVQRATRAPVQGVRTDGGRDLKLDQDGRMIIKDPGLAAEIRSEYPTEFTVSRVRAPSKHERGHRYFFGNMPEMPWKRAKEEDDGIHEPGDAGQPAELQPDGGAQ